MVIWVSMIIFWPIPTCIPTKCEINLGPKVWYNMRLKNKFHITKMNNKISYKYGWSGFGFFTFLHFLVRVPTYKCSTPLENPCGFVHRLNFLRFMHVKRMHTTSIICASPCRTSFFHTKSMFLKGDFFGFWISIYWDFEA
jgi:hypothetical protein